MITVTYVLADGSARVLEVPEGTSLMKAAVNVGIPGIPGDCGGNLSCGTCHCYIADDWRAKIPEPRPEELAMLDCVLDVTDESRLTCQVVASPAIDGITVRVPDFKL